LLKGGYYSLRYVLTAEAKTPFLQQDVVSAMVNT